MSHKLSRDFDTTPAFRHNGPDSPLTKALVNIEKKLPPRSVVVICTNASEDKHIIEAKPEGTCSLCGEKVWVSPSTYKTVAYEKRDKIAFVCSICLVKEVGGKEEIAKLVWMAAEHESKKGNLAPLEWFLEVMYRENDSDGLLDSPKETV